MKDMIKRINGRLLAGLVVSTMAASIGNANASLITVATGYSTDQFQANAADYKTKVEAAVAIPSVGYGSTSVALFDNISNQSVFGGPNSNVAFAFTIDFGVTAAQAGSWDFRAGVDFGFGGAVFLDGVALGYMDHDMWWAGSYGNPSQFFDYAANLSAGNHRLSIYGLEGCCDGGQQAQFLAHGATGFTTFSSTDGQAAIPEPTTFALLSIGLLGFGVARKRKQ